LQPVVAKSGDYFISPQNLPNEGPFFSQKSISSCQNHIFQFEKNWKKLANNMHFFLDL